MTDLSLVLQQRCGDSGAFSGNHYIFLTQAYQCAVSDRHLEFIQ
jgi:hypothetical protein